MKSVLPSHVSPLVSLASSQARRLFFCALACALTIVPSGTLASPHAPGRATFAAPQLPTVDNLQRRTRTSGSPLQTSQAQNEVYLLSTRRLGTACDVSRISRELEAEKATVAGANIRTWSPTSLDDVLAADDPRRATVVFVHGNRVNRGTDKQLGKMIYGRLYREQSTDQPFRLIVWSWPASTIRGPIRDYRVKAARTDPAGWQLAWFLDRVNPHVAVGLIGYSYGARVVNGALHYLAGGTLQGRRLELVQRTLQPSYRALLIAAAVDADWLLPHRQHGRALEKVNRMTLLVNHLDPAMRLYRLSTQGRRATALGYRGLNPTQQHVRRGTVKIVDVSGGVGRSHFLSKYLARGASSHVVWRNILFADARHPSTSHTGVHDAATKTTLGLHQR